jgi:O-antigen/teichoic acid export membrane protein
VAFAAAATHELVVVVLGERWIEVVPIFQCLIPAAFVGTYNGAAGWVYVSLNRTGRHAKWGFFSAVVIVVAFCVGVPWGPIGVAIAFSVSQVALRHPAILYAFKGTFLQPLDLYRAIRWPTLASWFAGVSAFGLGFWAEAFGPLISLVLKGLVFALCYLGLWMMFPAARATAAESVRALKNLRQAP